MNRTRDYEALIILKSAGTEQEVAQSAVQLEEPIKKLGGRIESSQGLGRRRLAFRISRQVEGYYHFLRFQAPTDRLDELKRLYRLNEAVVRFLIITADEHAAQPQPTSAGGS
jgi:small subunit ribosomal protein S6